ncbi:DUF1642 domain-containing protein [Listeria monocytogenes]|uniref:DUF1642 domain-containing protein n=2 Tax=Listeria monocytogenes TaxID=1639 RepID=UPI000E767C21|nr:DUF1642 domain-containing protein [Listeria monocytogenes]EAA0206879.1 DUF1642 domain-containing protein [Listeria monocytogenes]EAA0212005.1 DUF1642 domain-containing protein [Listeria monocytogenes]EAC2587880.1 DUF1642 domain-containing protein [Listeria monocytogenes]EAC2591096.1 DUF1642 domain-containing protein [Listeria monocytogenes]EAC2657745.1 DUF1642 domain-containing protein [Listeria monocytogenes]
MRFKKGDKVEFIDQGELKQGVVTEIEETNHSIFYQIDYVRNMEITWITEDKLLSPAPVLKVPRFADDWISHCKQREYDLACLLDYEDSDMSAEMNDWLSSEDSNQELLMRAWLDGYEVEKEPLYYVQLIDHATGYLNVHYDNQKLVGSNDEASEYKTQFTESEIKAMNKGEAYWLLKEPVEEVEGEA